MKLNYNLVIIGLLVVVIGQRWCSAGVGVKPNTPKKPEVIGVDEKVDMKDYRTVRIGAQTWMAENLRVRVRGSLSVDNDAQNDRALGRLYTWAAARRACPPGWRLPTKRDLEILIRNYPYAQAGKEIRIGGGSGFNAALAGYFDHRDNRFYGKECFAHYWTADQYHFTDCAWLLYLDKDLAFADFAWYLSNQDGFSVRYLKNTGDGS